MDDINKNEAALNNVETMCETSCKTCARTEEQLLYLKADFENYRRNVQRDRALWGQSAQASLMLDLLPIVDNFERALKDLTSVQNSEESARLRGIELIYRELVSFLNRNGVYEMGDMLRFDPSKHEAIAQLELTDKTSGTIIDVVQKGYLFKDTVLRPAKVVVAK